MKLNVSKIPSEFRKAIPKGFRFIKRNQKDFLLVESLFCPNGHNLIDDNVRIHDEASIKLKVIIKKKTGYLYIDAFWGSHSKLFSFVPETSENDSYVTTFCPYCDVDLSENYACDQEDCSSEKSFILLLPGGTNKIHVCSRLGCPGHILEINDMPTELIESVSKINFFGAGVDEIFGGI